MLCASPHSVVITTAPEGGLPACALIPAWPWDGDLTTYHLHPDHQLRLLRHSANAVLADRGYGLHSAPAVQALRRVAHCYSHKRVKEMAVHAWRQAVEASEAVYGYGGGATVLARACLATALEGGGATREMVQVWQGVLEWVTQQRVWALRIEAAQGECNPQELRERLQALQDLARSLFSSGHYSEAAHAAGAWLRLCIVAQIAPSRHCLWVSLVCQGVCGSGGPPQPGSSPQAEGWRSWMLSWMAFGTRHPAILAGMQAQAEALAADGQRAQAERVMQARAKAWAAGEGDMVRGMEVTRALWAKRQPVAERAEAADVMAAAGAAGGGKKGERRAKGGSVRERLAAVRDRRMAGAEGAQPQHAQAQAGGGASSGSSGVQAQGKGGGWGEGAEESGPGLTQAQGVACPSLPAPVMAAAVLPEGPVERVTRLWQEQQVELELQRLADLEKKVREGARPEMDSPYAS